VRVSLFCVATRYLAKFAYMRYGSISDIVSVRLVPHSAGAVFISRFEVTTVILAAACNRTWVLLSGGAGSQKPRVRGSGQDYM